MIAHLLEPTCPRSVWWCRQPQRHVVVSRCQPAIRAFRAFRSPPPDQLPHFRGARTPGGMRLERSGTPSEAPGARPPPLPAHRRDDPAPPRRRPCIRMHGYDHTHPHHTLNSRRFTDRRFDSTVWGTGVPGAGGLHRCVCNWKSKTIFTPKLFNVISRCGDQCIYRISLNIDRLTQLSHKSVMDQ